MSKPNRPYPRAEVSRRAQAELRAGHPWVFEGELRALQGAPEDGALVDVVSDQGRYIGTGFYNSHSKIRVRLLSTNANDCFDAAFWERRVRYAWEYRKTVMGADIDACRVIFGEADCFPGLTVDRFGDMLVTQTLSLGIERIKHMLFPLIVKVLVEDGQCIRALYERNDVAIRALEGMEEGRGFYPIEGLPGVEGTTTLIRENGIEYEVDFENGQKTGFFLDQKYNRQAAARLAPGKRVLDCFTHTGSFALNAAKAGAAFVHAVDVSESAVGLAERNARRNGLEGRMRFEAADVFDLLPALIDARAKYDYIILDPPAFTKSRRTVDAAAQGYQEINLRAMQLLPRGGYLATCSCSHFMTEERFLRLLRVAAFDAHVTLRQIEARAQAPDHPILWNVPESNYLKFYLFQVV